MPSDTPACCVMMCAVPHGMEAMVMLQQPGQVLLAPSQAPMMMGSPLAAPPVQILPFPQQHLNVQSWGTYEEAPEPLQMGSVTPMVSGYQHVAAPWHGPVEGSSTAAVTGQALPGYHQYQCSPSMASYADAPEPFQMGSLPSGTGMAGGHPDERLVQCSAKDGPLPESHQASMDKTGTLRRRPRGGRRHHNATKAWQFPVQRMEESVEVGVSVDGAMSAEAEFGTLESTADTLLVKLRAGIAESEISERFRRLAFASQSTSRAAQLVLSNASAKETVALAAGLHGHVLAACRSPHANYVIQKLVELLPPSASSFVADELSGHGREMARHRFGCRLICRLLEHCVSNIKAPVFAEILSDAGELCRHEFGNYCVEHVLEFGHVEQRHVVASALCADAIGLAQQRCGSRIIEKALECCSGEDQAALVDAILTSGELPALAEDQFGCFVVKAILRMPVVLSRRAAAILRSERGQCRYRGVVNHELKSVGAEA